MSKHIEQIHQRRALLAMRAELQRFNLALQLEPLKKPLSHIDQALALGRRVRRHPVLLAVALAGFAVVGRNRWGNVARLGWSAWRMYRLFIKRKAD